MTLHVDLNVKDFRPCNTCKYVDRNHVAAYGHVIITEERLIKVQQGKKNLGVFFSFSETSVVLRKRECVSNFFRFESDPTSR